MLRKALSRIMKKFSSQSDSEVAKHVELVNVTACTQAGLGISEEQTDDNDETFALPAEPNKCDNKTKCFTASFPSLVVLAMVLISVVLGRQYVIDMLIYIDSLDWWESMVLFAVMFTLVGFPIMSGYVLLNIACGYTYGFVYGALMTSGCATYAILCAHFIMRKFCKVNLFLILYMYRVYKQGFVGLSTCHVINRQICMFNDRPPLCRGILVNQLSYPGTTCCHEFSCN